MKVYSNLDLDKRGFEGRTQLSSKVVAHLQEKGFTFTSDIKQAQLIHFHSSGVFDSYRAYKLKKQYNLPCIYSLYSNAQTEPVMHAINFYIQKRYFQPTATQFLASYTAALPLKLRAFFLNKLDKVIVPSEYLKKSFPKNGHIIRFGVDTEKFIPLEREENKKLKVAYFGHPGVFKGLNDFVSMSLLLPKDVECHVFMTQRFTKVDNYIQKRNPNIIIHGFVESITQAYNEMDIIVLPYRTKIGTVANPLVLLEAMACERAIVTTDFTFLKEITQGAAVHVTRYKPALLAQAVKELLEDSQKRKELGKKARERVLAAYKRSDMLKAYEDVYRSYSP